MILGVDPGRDKCGLAIVDRELVVHYQQVVATDKVSSKVQSLISTYNLELIVVGDGTTSQQLVANLDTELEIKLIDETNSTLEARKRFWQEHPPTGWRRLLPRSFQTPNQSLDDYVAIILVERYLAEGL
ncbi:MAG: pre-16S rRNA-processing nuclease YqgF [Bacillota bacterium]